MKSYLFNNEIVRILYHLIPFKKKLEKYNISI